MNEVLIRKAKKGDKDAFCRLMDENVQSMYKIAAAYLKNDEDVADAIQDTILSCYENLKSLKQNRYFKTWMIRILINKCKDMIQKKKLVSWLLIRIRCRKHLFTKKNMRQWNGHKY